MSEQIKTIKEIAQQIEDLNIKCRWCGRYYALVKLHYYPHSGGIPIKALDGKKAWVYFTCKKCGHDWSLQKLLHQAEIKQMQQTKL